MYSLLNRLLELIPFTISIILISIFSANHNSFISEGFTPAISAICVYYWSFTHYNLVGTLNIFLIGLFSDIMMNYPLGSDSISLLLAWYFASKYRSSVTKYGFSVFWGYFIYFLAIYFVSKFLILSLFFWQVDYYPPLLGQLIISFLLYPILHKIMQFIRLKKLIIFRL